MIIFAQNNQKCCESFVWDVETVGEKKKKKNSKKD